jgi:hypothetical protein
MSSPEGLDSHNAAAAGSLGRHGETLRGPPRGRRQGLNHGPIDVLGRPEVNLLRFRTAG